MPKLTRLTKNLITKSSLLGEPSTPGYVEITSNTLRRNQNLSDLTDKAEARKNLGVIGVDDIDVGPTGDTVVRRGESGTIKAADAVEANDVVTKLQLDNKTYDLSGDKIHGVLPLTKGGLGTTTLSDARSLIIPVGFIYIQLRGQSTPDAIFGTGGKWQDISSEYAGEFFRAVGGSSASFGSKQNEGLPNITGNFTLIAGASIEDNRTGAFYKGAPVTADRTGGTFIGSNVTEFSASRSNSIYGASTHVTPYNSSIRIWKKIA